MPLLLKLSVHFMLLLFLLTLLILANFGLLSIKLFIIKFLILCTLALIILLSLTHLLHFSSPKIHQIHINLLTDVSRTSPHVPCPHTPPKFDFGPSSVDQMSKLIDESNDTATLILFLPLLRNVNLLYFLLSPISSIFLLPFAFFLINLDIAQFILSLRNLTVIKRTCLIIDLYPFAFPF
jgi:hypothetical protein